MRGLLRGYRFNASVAQRPQVDPFEQRFSLAEQDGRNSDMHFIDEARAEVLPDRGRPAADAHVHAGGGFACKLERLVNPFGDEAERRAAFHFDGGRA